MAACTPPVVYLMITKRNDPDFRDSLETVIGDAFENLMDANAAVRKYCSTQWNYEAGTEWYEEKIRQDGAILVHIIAFPECEMEDMYVQKLQVKSSTRTHAQSARWKGCVKKRVVAGG